jgi:hypothetical protein
LYARAELAGLFELNLLAGHRHASVRHYAAALLAGGYVDHQGNPLHDFSLQV